MITTYGEEHLTLPPKYFYIATGPDAGLLSKIKSLIAGYKMVPHAQAWADACREATGAKSFGTYPDHSPTPERAIDTFTPVPSDRRAPSTKGLSRVLGDDIADFSLETLRNGNPYGIDYVIWRQHIYNPEIADHWRPMENRNGVTNNHFDHNHNSFNPTASGKIVPPTEEIDVMALSVRYIWGPDALNQTDWVFDGPSHVHATGMTSQVLRACDKGGVVELGKVDDQTHRWFENVAAGWRQ